MYNFSRISPRVIPLTKGGRTLVDLPAIALSCMGKTSLLG